MGVRSPAQLPHIERVVLGKNPDCKSRQDYVAYQAERYFFLHKSGAGSLFAATGSAITVSISGKITSIVAGAAAVSFSASVIAEHQ